ncbi:HrpE/YscL family type III secretion apparatus protein [Thalassospira sp. MA62]|nr:HrpE/YscL family type III secretion apparatus protein [Thalassospira sp. MA62]
MAFRIRNANSSISVDPSARVVKGGSVDAIAQAKDIIAQAQHEADQIRQDAKDAFEAEKKRGYEAGLAEARLEEAERMLDNVSRTVNYFEKVEHDVVGLVTTAVTKVIGELDSQDRIYRIVRNGLAAVRTQNQVTVRLNPNDADGVKARINDLLGAYPAISYLTVEPDVRLSPGACILETDIGSVEAGIETQLAAISNAFERVLGSKETTVTKPMVDGKG